LTVDNLSDKKFLLIEMHF